MKDYDSSTSSIDRYKSTNPSTVSKKNEEDQPAAKTVFALSNGGLESGFGGVPVQSALKPSCSPIKEDIINEYADHGIENQENFARSL